MDLNDDEIQSFFSLSLGLPLHLEKIEINELDRTSNENREKKRHFGKKTNSTENSTRRLSVCFVLVLFLRSSSRTFDATANASWDKESFLPPKQRSGLLRLLLLDVKINRLRNVPTIFKQRSMLALLFLFSYECAYQLDMDVFRSISLKKKRQQVDDVLHKIIILIVFLIGFGWSDAFACKRIKIRFFVLIEFGFGHAFRFRFRLLLAFFGLFAR